MYRLCIRITMILTVLLLGSCRKYVGSDLTEKEHPAIREARVLVQEQNVAGAEMLLLETLRREPALALAHLQLGMVYQSQENSVAALYHFQHYLDARPDGEKAEILRQVVDDERRRLAAQVGTPVTFPSAERNPNQVDRQLAEAQQRVAVLEVELQQARFQTGGQDATPPPEWAEERLSLLKEIRELRQSLQASPSFSPTTTASIPSLGRTYTVQRGDTLSRIAQQTYGRASDFQKIYDANKAVIPNKNVLTPGTVLVLP